MSEYKSVMISVDISSRAVKCYSNFYFELTYRMTLISSSESNWYVQHCRIVTFVFMH